MKKKNLEKFLITKNLSSSYQRNLRKILEEKWFSTLDSKNWKQKFQ